MRGVTRGHRRRSGTHRLSRPTDRSPAAERAAALLGQAALPRPAGAHGAPSAADVGGTTRTGPPGAARHTLPGSPLTARRPTEAAAAAAAPGTLARFPGRADAAPAVPETVPGTAGPRAASDLVDAAVRAADLATSPPLGVGSPATGPPVRGPAGTGLHDPGADPTVIPDADRHGTARPDAVRTDVEDSTAPSSADAAAVRTDVGSGSRAGAGTGEEASALHPPPRDGDPGPVRGDPRPRSARPSGARWQRLGLAVRERTPLWWQTRFGVEPRTLAALAVVLIVAAGFATYHFWSARPETVHAPAVEGGFRPTGPAQSGGSPGEASRRFPPTSLPGAAGATAAGDRGPGDGDGRTVVVDVSGKVREPGVHRLPLGSRVADALSAAGGVRPGTDLSGLNRARVLSDGEQILVGAAPGPPPAGQASGSGPGAASGPAGGGAPVSLDTATAEQLDTLPGVGPVLAQHILDYRAEHGGFRSVEELREVPGIGDRRFAELRPLVRP